MRRKKLLFHKFPHKWRFVFSSLHVRVFLPTMGEVWTTVQKAFVVGMQWGKRLLRLPCLKGEETMWERDLQSGRWMELLNEKLKHWQESSEARWCYLNDEQVSWWHMSDQLLYPLVKLRNQQSHLFGNVWYFWLELLIGWIPVSSSAR